MEQIFSITDNPAATPVRRDYIGRFELTGDSIAKILFPTGFLTPADTTLHTFIPDCQGNIIGVHDSRRNTLEQFTDYYPYGLPHASATSPEVNRRKYGGKELTTDLGQNLYDFAARWQNPAFPAFTTPDPLAEKYYQISPYAYCAGDPINLIDPSGMAAFVYNGKIIGYDGVDNDDVYVIKNAKSSYRSGDYEISGAGLSKDEQKRIEKFIKENNGNSEAFANEKGIYDNCVKIVSSKEVRQKMNDIVCQDNGAKGTSEANNREYGGYINADGGVTEVLPGVVSTPRGSDMEVSININVAPTTSTFHSHPSGNTTNRTMNYSYSAQSFGDRCEPGGYYQPPSITDINNASTEAICYVFARGQGVVYIYNGIGVQATIPQNKWVNLK